jgi:hypothetical protein
MKYFKAKGENSPGCVGLGYAGFHFMGELSPELWRVLMFENWAELSRQAVRLAGAEMNRYRWRGTKKGILPDGYDAASVAAEAVAELFRGNCNLGLTYSREELETEIRRLVHQQIDRLHRRRENWLLRNGAGLDPPSENIWRRKVLEQVPDHGPLPDEETSRLDEQKEFGRFKTAALEQLNGDVEAQAVFECFCDGMGKRSAQAVRIGVNTAAVKNATKRLKRKLRNLYHSW